MCEICTRQIGCRHSLSAVYSVLTVLENVFTDRTLYYILAMAGLKSTSVSLNVRMFGHRFLSSFNWASLIVFFDQSSDPEVEVHVV